MKKLGDEATRVQESNKRLADAKDEAEKAAGGLQAEGSQLAEEVRRREAQVTEAVARSREEAERAASLVEEVARLWPLKTVTKPAARTTMKQILPLATAAAARSRLLWRVVRATKAQTCSSVWRRPRSELM